MKLIIIGLLLLNAFLLPYIAWTVSALLAIQRVERPTRPDESELPASYRARMRALASNDPSEYDTFN